MAVLRTFVFWIFTALWTVVVLGAGCITSVLTLGLIRHRLAAVFGPLYGRPCLWVAGIRYRVSGWEHVAAPSARIITFNHASFLEVLIFAALGIPRFSYLGKKSFAYIPVLGQAWWLLGGRFVDRSNRRRAMASIKQLGHDLRTHGLSTLIAPEGTRSRDGRLQPFKMGAFHMALDTGAPIVPLVFHGVFEMLRPDDWKLSPGTVHIELHPPIDTTGWTRESLRGHADALHARYAAWLEEGPRG
jgi:1-acyl-sn-glycerol-3-phosphate acyltransferase